MIGFVDFLAEAHISLSFILPVGLSANDLYADSEGGRKRRSEAYMAWAEHATTEILVQRGRTAVKSQRRGCYCGLLLLAIDNSARMDNWGKEVFDMLHHMRVTPDDKYLYRFATARDADTKAGTCGIVVWSLPKAVRHAA